VYIYSKPFVNTHTHTHTHARTHAHTHTHTHAHTHTVNLLVNGWGVRQAAAPEEVPVVFAVFSFDTPV